MDNDTLPNTADATPIVENTTPTVRESLQNAFKEVAAKEAAPDADASIIETPTQQHARDEAGKFVAKTADAQITDKPSLAAPETALHPDTTQQTAEAPNATGKPLLPPAGWSPASKVAFDALPDAVKADIAKREELVSAGFAKYSGLDQYVQEFEAAGVRLPDAIAAYRAAEDQLTRNFPQGVVGLCQQFNVHPVQLAQHLLQQYGQGGQEGPQPQSHAQPDAQSQQAISQLQQQLNKLEQERYQERSTAVETDISKFISDPSNKFVDNVVDQMALLINAAKLENRHITLKEAYDAACWSDPQVRPLLLDEQFAAKSKAAQDKAKQAADQARRSAASVTGAPLHNTPSGVDGAQPSRRDVLAAAFAEQAGRV